jgi:hypothetical protein
MVLWARAHSSSVVLCDADTSAEVDVDEEFAGNCLLENRVSWNGFRPDLADRLDATLRDATDERPLQAFFEEYPFVLPLALFGGLHQYSWAFPRPRLGGGTFIPDFLACDRDSLGFQWKIIELESPLANPLNKDDSVSRACHHAVQQIRDYRRWLRDKLAFERQQGWPGISGECECWVVIGRRQERRRVAQERLADFKGERIAVHSYDHVLENYKRAQAFIDGSIRQTEEFERQHGPFPGLPKGRVGGDVA